MKKSEIQPDDLRGWRLSAELSPEDLAAKIRRKGLRCQPRTVLALESWRRGSYDLLRAIADLSDGILDADALYDRELGSRAA